MWDDWQQFQVEARKKREKAEAEAEVKRMKRIDALKTFEREIGRFESASGRELEQIRQNLSSAFDSEMIFEDALNNLKRFAEDEYSELLIVQRNRDELFAQRELAADTIFGVARAVAESAQLLGLLSDVEEKTKEIEMTEVINGLVKSADGLKDFKATITRTFIDTVVETVDKTRSLTDGFQSVIDKTRLFIDNLKTLEELGLDPFLFNQLVEAGAEAGGATAQALVDGGADTIKQINSLQGELNAMGVELGELTYDTMKDQGELFVSGIIDGLDDQLAELELEAYTMAQAFADAFETAFNQAISAMELNQIQTAQAAAAEEIRAITEETRPVFNKADADRLETLIAGAQRYASNIGDLTKAAGAGTKATIYEGLLDDLLAGRQVNLSGIESGMSSAELAQAALAARNPGTTNTFNVTVESNTRDGGAKAGEAFLASVGAAINANGTITTTTGKTLTVG
jgi:hypothetical protein